MITVIIPAYNAEKCIDRCIQSLIMQANSKFKVIIVNDGSSDRTREICHKYLKNNDYINYIEQKNMGVGAARNTGLELCTTSHVCFLDSDDEFPANAIEMMEKEIEKAELVIGGICKKQKNKEKLFIPKRKILNKKIDIDKSVIEDMYFINSACGKIYNYDVIKSNNIRFSNMRYGEDTEFVYSYLKYIKSVYFVSEIWYCVNVTENSASLKTIPYVWECMENLYEKGIEIDNNEYLSQMLLLRSIKTTLLVKIREGKSEFIKTCEKIILYIKTNSIKYHNYKGIYNKFVWKNLNRENYKLLYLTMKLREYLNI